MWIVVCPRLHRFVKENVKSIGENRTLVVSEVARTTLLYWTGVQARGSYCGARAETT